ncbi:MAG: hypothetical protein JWR44_3545 [Hymenobacter sp.]|jgi:hypothetical protein|nr:hypothetical protein [Hymenobacter sp.]
MVVSITQQAWRLTILAAALLGLSITASAQTTPIRVLFVGNSFTHGQFTPVLYYNSGAVTDLNFGLPAGNPRAHDAGMPNAFGGVPGIFKKFTDQAGLNYNVQIEAVSGTSLQFHHTNALSVIAQPTWDKVVLQEQSVRPVPTARGGNRSAFYTAATQLEQAIHTANAATQVYLYETWARADFTYPSGQSYSGFPIDTMTQDLHNGYYAQFFANGRYAGVAPVGDAWLNAITTGVAMRNPYTPDPSKVNLWNVDHVHPSISGSYLSALVLFYKLTGVDPRTLGGTEQAAATLGLTPAQAIALQQVAWQQVNVVVQGPSTTTAFTPGNVAVVRVGDGSAALTTAATAEFVAEYTLGGTLVRTIALPTVDNGNVRAFTNSGTATSDNITRSTDGRYLLLTGYNAVPGTTGIVTTTNSGTTNNRLVARIAADGSVDTNTRINDAFSGTNIRTAVSTDGNAFYVSGGNSGIRYVPFGNAGPTTALSTGTLVNFRILGIYGGNLYATSAANANFGINQIGTGLPTAAGAAVTLLPGFPTATGPSPYGFYFADLSTTVPGLDVVYVTDDASTGGIQKWSLVGGTWTLNGLIGGSTTALLRGLTGQRTGAAVQLVASGGGGLYSVSDQAGYNAAPSTTALPAPFVALPTNTSFRGVAFTPVATALATTASAAAPEVSVYPNPAADQLTVQLSGLTKPAGAVRATLLNLLGQVVAEQRGTGSTLTLGLADVAPGVYLLRLQTAAGVSSRRVEVRR